MCSPVRPVKLQKNPTRERRPRSCRWLDRRDVPVWTPPPLCLSFFSVAPSPFSLVLVFSSVHIPPPATLPSSLPSPSVLCRESAAPSRCRCGSTSCAACGATCGRCFQQTWPRRRSARCCPRRCSCWCRDTTVSGLRTGDNCKSGAAHVLQSWIFSNDFFHHCFTVFTVVTLFTGCNNCVTLFPPNSCDIQHLKIVSETHFFL